MTNQWIYTQDDLEKNTPTRRDNIDYDSELEMKQFSAVFINELGCKLKISQICINTAIVFMHRFYMIHSLKKFHHNIVSVACLFFACKVEERPRPLRYFMDTVQQHLHKKASILNPNSEEYKLRIEEIMTYESCLVQTLGFSLHVNQIHAVIVKIVHLIKAPRDLSQTAYLTATNCLLLTNFCLLYSYEIIACFCIYLSCKYFDVKIPISSEGKEWYLYVNSDLNNVKLDDMVSSYIKLYESCPLKIKRKLGFDAKSKDLVHRKSLQPVDLMVKAKKEDNVDMLKKTAHVVNSIHVSKSQPNLVQTIKPTTPSGQIQAKSYKDYLEMKKQQEQLKKEKEIITETKSTQDKSTNKLPVKNKMIAKHKIDEPPAKIQKQITKTEVQTKNVVNLKSDLTKQKMNNNNLKPKKLQLSASQTSIT